MKISVAYLIFVVVFLTACRTTSPTPEPPNISPATPTHTSPTATPNVDSSPPVTMPPSAADPLDFDWDDRAIFGKGLISTQQEVLNQLPGATAYHLDLEIADDMLHLTGKEEIYYTNREQVPLNEIYLRLFPNMAGGKSTVSELMVNGQSVEPVYQFEDTAVRVSLPQPLPPGSSTKIALNFEIEVPQEMSGNYGLFVYHDNILVLDEFYPTIPVYDDEGWNVEAPPPNADLTYNDAAFYVARITAPANVIILTSGIEIAQKMEGNKQTATFAAGPARDFYVAASQNFIKLSQTVGETTINSYALPEYQAHAEMALTITADSLRSFNSRFGPYPYTEFDVVSTPMQALGIEYPGIVGIALFLYDPQEEVGGTSSAIFLESTVAHEVAHQWFYNTVGNDQVDEPWLDEALAQYATRLYYLDTYGEDTAQAYANSWQSRWERVDGEDIPIGLTAGDYEGAEYGAIVYGRGPLFVAALAEEMGQDKFDEFLQDYAQSYQWDIATGEDFQQLAETHCQCDLTNLFTTWVYGP